MGPAFPGIYDQKVMNIWPWVQVLHTLITHIRDALGYMT